MNSNFDLTRLYNYEVTTEVNGVQRVVASYKTKEAADSHVVNLHWDAKVKLRPSNEGWAVILVIGFLFIWPFISF